MYPQVPWQVYLSFTLLIAVISLLVLRHYRRSREGVEQKQPQVSQLYVEALDALPECILIADANERLLFINYAVLDVLDKSMGEVLGMSMFTLLFPIPREAENVRQHIKKAGNYQNQINYPSKGEGERSIEMSISAVEHTEHAGIRYIGIIKDVTDRTIAEAKRQTQHRHLMQMAMDRSEALEQQLADKNAIQADLEDSLAEKTKLIKEVCRGASSNMQVIASLLNMQADRVLDAGTPNDQASNLFISSRRRVESIFLMYAHLYHSENMTDINIEEYVDLLSSTLCRGFARDGIRVHVALNIKDIFLHPDIAFPCGLIINELVTNSLQHAFVEQSGTISISIIQQGANYVLTIADDGLGFSGDIRDETSPSKGVEIVAILATQLGGKLTYSGNAGAWFELRFPVVQ